LGKVVEELAERGVGFIKVMASGGMGSKAHSTQFDLGSLNSLVKMAADFGLKVVAHAHALRAISDSVAAGVWGIEHCTFMTENGIVQDRRLIEEIAEKGIYVGCTVAKPRADMPPAVAATLEPYWANNAYMHVRGVKLVCCTDAGINPVKTHDVLPSDMAYFASQVCSNADTLRSVTTVAAASCGISGSKGAVREGMDADLIVIDGNPIEDIGSLRKVRAVYRSGIVVDRTAS
jgi:imidazolonepropionase-like amidohydrolase